MADVKKLAEELVNLKVTEVNELAQILKEEYGIEPAAAAVAVAAPAAGAGEAAAAEKSSFDVILKSGGQAKLQVIKVVKDLAGLSLGDAKALVDGAPKAVKEGVSKEEAEQIRPSWRRQVPKSSSSKSPVPGSSAARGGSLGLR